MLGAAQSLGSRDCLDYFLFLKVGGGSYYIKKCLNKFSKDGYPVTEPFHT